MTAPRKAPVCPAPSEAGAVPLGLVCVPVGKGCVLLLSEGEYARAIKRWKRREVLRQRTENRR